jgi:hypothetical protein
VWQSFSEENRLPRKATGRLAICPTLLLCVTVALGQTKDTGSDESASESQLITGVPAAPPAMLNRVNQMDFTTSDGFAPGYLPLLINPYGVSARRSEVKKERFDWVTAYKQTFLLLGLQNSFRMMEPKTRRDLGGRFFADWFDAASNLHGWSDGDSFFTQYVGHPIQGAWAGYIQIQNDPAGRNLEFSNTRPYWNSRLKATAFAAAYEILWHLGPISEASIGHVGKKDGTLGMSEFVTSPVGGLGIIVMEDWLDSRFVRRWEEQTTSLQARRIYRMLLNPQRSLMNCLRIKKPWYRDSRSISFGIN